MTDRRSQAPLHAFGALPRLGGAVAEGRGKALGSRCVWKTVGGGCFPAREGADLERSSLDENRDSSLRVAAAPCGPVLTVGHQTCFVEQDESLGSLDFLKFHILVEHVDSL